MEDQTGKLTEEEGITYGMKLNKAKCELLTTEANPNIHFPKGEKSKTGVGGSARARFGAPFKGTQRKVAVFLHETQFPLQDVVLKMVAPDR